MSSHKKILWNCNEFCPKNFDIHELLEFFLFLQLISGLNYSCSLWHISYQKVWLENSKKKVLCKEKKKTTAKTPCTDISKSCDATRWSKLVNVLHQRFTFTVLLAGILRKKGSSLQHHCHQGNPMPSRHETLLLLGWWEGNHGTVSSRFGGRCT